MKLWNSVTATKAAMVAKAFCALSLLLTTGELVAEVFYAGFYCRDHRGVGQVAQEENRRYGTGADEGKGHLLVLFGEFFLEQVLAHGLQDALR